MIALQNEDAERFLAMSKKAGAKTSAAFARMLMDAYEGKKPAPKKKAAKRKVKAEPAPE